MSVDMDSHLREGFMLDEVYKLEEPYAQFTPRRVREGKSMRVRFMHDIETLDRKSQAVFFHPYLYDSESTWRDGQVATWQLGGYDMAQRREDMRREPVDRQLLFPTAITIPTTNTGGLGLALCQAYNNWVANLVKGHEDLFLPVAMAPAGCPDAMSDELRRCVKKLGMKTGHLVPYCGPHNLDDPVFYPYYETAQELDVPLLCHPVTNGVLTERFDNFFKMHVLGRPMNCTHGLIALILGGIFERFPRLKVVFFECSAEWIPYWIHRMDDDYEWAKKHPRETGADRVTMPPSEYAKRNCYVTCEADEKRLQPAIEELGEDHILMATDYPHFDSEFPGTVSEIRSRSDLTETQKEKILGGNAARILNL